MSYEWLEPAPRGTRRQTETVTRGSREDAAAALHKASEYLFAQQAPDGFWCGELTADTTLESDYILLQLWLHQPEGAAWNPPSRTRIDKAARSILERQLPDGGFNIYSGGPSEVSATVKAYSALKLAGIPPDAEPLRRARERILALGGLQAANSYVKINLSLFGLYPRKLRPHRSARDRHAAGQRALRDVLVDALHPGAALHRAGARRQPQGAPDGFTVDELLLPGVSLALPHAQRTLRAVSDHLDRVFKVWEKRGSERIRAAAIRQAERWILARTQHTEGLGAIYPAMMYFIMALDALGLRRRPSRPASRPSATSNRSSSKPATASSSSPASRPSGTPPSAPLPWAKPASTATRA